MPMTTAQQRHLKERLQGIVSSKPTRYTSIDLDETKEVKAANKVIDAFNKKKEEARKRRNEAISKMRSDCERAIYFGNPLEALKAIDAFEAAKF